MFGRFGVDDEGWRVENGFELFCGRIGGVGKEVMKCDWECVVYKRKGGGWEG